MLTAGAAHADRRGTEERYLDRLTTLPNRAAFAEAFDVVSRLARRARAPITLAVLDLDHFRRVNELSGPWLGDQVLFQATFTISSFFRTAGYLARWKDDEIAVLLPNRFPEDSMHLLERVRASLENGGFRTGDGRIHEVTASVGLLETEPGAPLCSTMAQGYRSVARAKLAGRNRIHVGTGELPPAPDTILLVEEDLLTASLVIRRFERQGWKVLHTADATSGLEIAARGSVSLAVLNARMKEMAAFEALESLRQNLRSATLPVIVLGETGNESDLIRCFQLGADDYLPKPFSLDELVARTQRRLSASAARERVASLALRDTQPLCYPHRPAASPGVECSPSCS